MDFFGGLSVSLPAQVKKNEYHFHCVSLIDVHSRTLRPSSFRLPLSQISSRCDGGNALERRDANADNEYTHSQEAGCSASNASMCSCTCCGTASEVPEL